MLSACGLYVNGDAGSRLAHTKEVSQLIDHKMLLSDEASVVEN